MSPVGLFSFFDIIGFMSRVDFEWRVNNLNLLDSPELTAIARAACYYQVVWPEELVGTARAGTPTAPPEDSGITILRGFPAEPSRLGYVVLARRAAWYLSSELTDLSAAEIGEAFGGHAKDTVRRFIGTGSVALMERLYYPEIGDKLDMLRAAVLTDLSGGPMYDLYF